MTPNIGDLITRGWNIEQGIKPSLSYIDNLINFAWEMPLDCDKKRQMIDRLLEESRLLIEYTPVERVISTPENYDTLYPGMTIQDHWFIEELYADAITKFRAFCNALPCQMQFDRDMKVMAEHFKGVKTIELPLEKRGFTLYFPY